MGRPPSAAPLTQGARSPCNRCFFVFPLKADWLPAGLPLWLVLLAVFLLLAAALYWGGARLAPRWSIDPKSVQGAAAGWPSPA